jgi:hypothetical protein
MQKQGIFCRKNKEILAANGFIIKALEKNLLVCVLKFFLVWRQLTGFALFSAAKCFCRALLIEL